MNYVVHPTAIVESDSIGDNATIDEYVVVRKNVTIGKNVRIHPFCVIESGVIIEDNVEIFPGCYVGKEPKGKSLSRKPDFKKEIIVGKNCGIGPHAVIYYDVQIGENTLIGDGASIREHCRIGKNCLISRYVTLNYNAHIGDDTKIMDLTHITGNSVIENNVFISTHVGTTNDNSMGRLGYQDDKIIGPQIKSQATIGAGVVLLPRIIIGNNVTVGAGSVVTKTISDNKVVMGTPAREKL